KFKIEIHLPFAWHAICFIHFFVKGRVYEGFNEVESGPLYAVPGSRDRSRSSGRQTKASSGRSSGLSRPGVPDGARRSYRGLCLEGTRFVNDGSGTSGRKN